MLFIFGKLPRPSTGLEFIYISGSQLEVIFPPSGTFGNVWRHLWMSTAGAAGIYWAVTRDAAKYSTMHRTSVYPA